MEKEKKVAIEKIVLNIEGEKVSLTPEQAKKLKTLLDEMFGKEIVKEIIREEHHHHNDWYPRPTWYWNYSTPHYNDFNKVYCQNTSAGILDSSTSLVNYCSSNNALEINL